ncbi:MAG: DUF2934 domain-containing protein, partial [Candidatus Omnitrophota bacterium]
EKLKVKKLPENFSKVKDFLHARMYYLDTDSQTEDKALNEQIKERAYYLWQELGMPQGEDEKIWMQAEEEFKGKEKIIRMKNKFQTQTSFPSAKIKSENESLQSRVKNLEEAYRNLAESIEKLQSIQDSLIYPAYPESGQKKDSEDNVVFENMHGNKIYLNKIACLEQEKIALIKQIAELEQDKAVSQNFMLEKKDLQEKIKKLVQEKEILLTEIFQLNQKNADLKTGNSSPELLTRLKTVQQESIRLANKIIILQTEKENLRNLVAEKTAQGFAGKQTLVDKINSLEQERLSLLKGGKNRENDKSSVLSLKNQIIILEAELKQTEKEKNKFYNKIRQLENKIEQEKEKIALIEPLQEQQELLQKEKQQIIQAREELFKENQEIKQQIAELIKDQTQLLQKIAELETRQLDLNKKNLKKNQIDEKIKENKQMLKPDGFKAHVLDQDKLTQLKEFTLEAVRVSKGKNADFINGAYNAVNLFYHSILSDRPVKK